MVIEAEDAKERALIEANLSRQWEQLAIGRFVEAEAIIEEQKPLVLLATHHMDNGKCERLDTVLKGMSIHPLLREDAKGNAEQSKLSPLAIPKSTHSINR